jgi:nucleotide-binding universal stress UspA family protein
VSGPEPYSLTRSGWCHPSSGGRSLISQTDRKRPEGLAAHALLRLADELNADLIAMTTRGRAGLGRLVFGSVSGEVPHRSTGPLLEVRVKDHLA